MYKLHPQLSSMIFEKKKKKNSKKALLLKKVVCLFADVHDKLNEI